MAPPHNRKIKLIEFSLGATSFECQIRNWRVANNTEDGERIFTQCPEGEIREEADPDYALELTFLDDWRANGISDFLTAHNKEWMAFTIDHHPDIPAEHVQWSGEVLIKAPSAGGEARTTESNEITLPIKGEPVYARVGA